MNQRPTILVVSRPTLLVVGQASQKTGLARVTRAIATHLAGLYDVHVLGIDCFDTDGATSRVDGWTLHTNPAAHDCYAELALTALMDELRPSLVLLYNDVWVIHRYFQRLEQALHHCPTVAYCPIDGPIMRPDHVVALAPLDALVVFTEFARSIVRQCAWQEHLAASEPFQSVRVIPHGLDTSAFFPWPANTTANTPANTVDEVQRRTLARQALFPSRPDLRDGFWVLNANRNQPRKRLDLTLKGFARFAANKPANVRLYLHTGLNEIGIDVMREADRLGITGRLILTHGGDGHPESSTPELNAIYNACEVGVNTATGEGWGLISCEHAATRAAQIVPRHSACAEIWEGAAEFLPPVATETNGFIEGGVIDPVDLADRLERLYADPLYCQSRGLAAHQRITNAVYGWEEIATQWDALFEDILAREQTTINSNRKARRMR